MSNQFKFYTKLTTILMVLFTILSAQNKDPKRELKRLNAKIDRVRVMVDSLELDNQILLPELMSAFKQAVKSKAQQDSITLVILKRINTLSNDLNLENFLNKKTGELSSGQKNRVSLAKSLINNPEILLLDEPTASLDPDTGDYVRSYIENYAKQNNTTILLASHNMSEVERLCDSIIMMRKGKIIDKGTCEQLIKKHGRDNLEETFLKLARSKDEF